MASYHRALSARERVALDWLDLPTAPPLPAQLCCDGFRRGVFAASVADPTCCVRCAAARRAEALAARYAELRALRVAVTEAIEPLRREKVVGSSLAAAVTVPDSAPEADLAELFITAAVTRGPVDAVKVAPTSDHKCGRCWRHLPEVSADGELCSRCEQVVSAMDAAE